MKIYNTLTRKIEEFNDWLSKQKGYKTDFLRIGDGMSVSTKLWAKLKNLY